MQTDLTDAQLERYARHVVLEEVGEEGQLKLLDAKVLLLGAGGLGSPAALYLAAAGVGTIGIIDMDVVDESNLQRQILHNIERVGDRKVDSAKKTLTLLNPDVDVVSYDVRLGAEIMALCIEDKKAPREASVAIEKKLHAALFERGDEPVDAGLRLEVERFLHLIKGWGHARLLQPLMDEHEKLFLLRCEHLVPFERSGSGHRAIPQYRRLACTNHEQFICSICVPQARKLLDEACAAQRREIARFGLLLS